MASDWEQAETHLDGEVFDIVVCDFYLKDMNATDLMDRMRELGIEKPVGSKS